MVKTYQQFTQKQFEFFLKNILIENKLAYVKTDFLDITEPMINKGYETFERIYTIKTKQKNRRLVIFSSVDIRTGKTRDKGADAIRIVEWIKTEHGNRFKRVKKHLRINTLKDNLQKTLIDAITKESFADETYKTELHHV